MTVQSNAAGRKPQAAELHIEHPIFSNSMQESGIGEILHVATMKDISPEAAASAYEADCLVNQQLASMLDMLAVASINLDSAQEPYDIGNALELVAGIIRIKDDALGTIHKATSKVPVRI